MKLNDVNMNVRNILFLLYENHCFTLLVLLLYCIIIIIIIIIVIIIIIIIIILHYIIILNSISSECLCVWNLGK